MTKSPFYLSKGTRAFIFCLFQSAALILVTLWLFVIITCGYATAMGVTFEEAWHDGDVQLLCFSLVVLGAIIYLLAPDTKKAVQNPSAPGIYKQVDTRCLETEIYHD